MRKKTLFIVLCLLSGILTLGGCGKSETDDAKTQKSEAKSHEGVEFGEYSLRQYRYAKEYYKYVKEELENGL